jgi:tubulin-folding cofactor B
MAFQPTPMDISVLITTPTISVNSESQFVTERRITPTWTVMQLKSKLETMTGIPPNHQRLKLKTPAHSNHWVDGDETIIGDWGLMKGCEIEVRFIFLVFIKSCFVPLLPSTCSLEWAWVLIPPADV